MKKFLNILLRIFIVIIVLCMLGVATVVGFVAYSNWEKEKYEVITYSGEKQIITSKKIELEDTVTGLFLGVNSGLTDFIMLGKYDPNTREINLMSIPRDTYVEDTIDGKINSAYARKFNVQDTINVVEKLTGVKVDYYVLFKTKVLRELVDEVGGVTVDVPINMNYDDPYQNLHIHLNKGTQLLDGKKAEQFVRFRKNNNNTGYVRGDVDRVQAQQKFIKAMILRCLEPQNLIKLGNLVQIVIDNTVTNVTMEVASDYIDDAFAFKPDRIRMEVLPGEGGYSKSGISYFFVNEEEAVKLINELFNQETDMEEVEELIKQEELESGSVPIIRTEFSGDIINIEVLNNGASSTNFNLVVEQLTEEGYNVVRVGNSDDKNNASRIISYVSSEEALERLTEVSKLIGINKLETSAGSNPGIDFSIVLGPKYVPEKKAK